LRRAYLGVFGPVRFLKESEAVNKAHRSSARRAVVSTWPTSALFVRSFAQGAAGDGVFSDRLASKLGGCCVCVRGFVRCDTSAVSFFLGHPPSASVRSRPVGTTRPVRSHACMSICPLTVSVCVKHVILYSESRGGGSGSVWPA
jgi:hypothetical protein